MLPAVRQVSSLEVRDKLKDKGFLQEEIAILEDITATYRDDTSARTVLAAPGAKGRATRATLFRDWFYSVYDIKKTPVTDAKATFFLRYKTPHVDTSSHSISPASIVFSAYSFSELRAFINELTLIIFPKFTASSDFSETFQTVILSATDLVPEFESDYLYLVGNKIVHTSANPEEEFEIIDLVKDGYIDSEYSAFLKQMPNVFYKFFDTDIGATRGDNDIVAMPTLTPDHVSLLEESYDQTLRALNDDNQLQQLKELALPEILEWCCGSVGRYKDIIHMASARLKKHDFGVYFLLGQGRNAKSTCIDLIASLYGTNNLCRVPVERLGDWHNLHNFQRALVNLPDEQKVDERRTPMNGDEVRSFRIAAAHGSENMHVMSSNESVQLSYSFTTIAPVNSMPNFPQDAQRACIERCRIIEFLNDFSASDKSEVKWGKAHFTPEFMMRFAGQVLAFANYYSRNAWVESSEMSLARQKQYEDSASVVKYMKIWEKFFCGFSSHKLLRADYTNYCTLSDLEPEQFTRNSIVLQAYSTKERRIDPLSKERYRATVNPYKRKACKDRIMYSRGRFVVVNGEERCDITGGKTIEDFVTKGGSIIYELEDRGLLEKYEQLTIPFDNGDI